jgi:hypothetical protein
VRCGAAPHHSAAPFATCSRSCISDAPFTIVSEDFPGIVIRCGSPYGWRSRKRDGRNEHGDRHFLAVGETAARISRTASSSQARTVAEGRGRRAWPHPREAQDRRGVREWHAIRVDRQSFTQSSGVPWPEPTVAAGARDARFPVHRASRDPVSARGTDVAGSSPGMSIESNESVESPMQ